MWRTCERHHNLIQSWHSEILLAGSYTYLQDTNAVAWCVLRCSMALLY